MFAWVGGREGKLIISHINIALTNQDNLSTGIWKSTNWMIVWFYYWEFRSSLWFLSVLYPLSTNMWKQSNFAWFSLSLRWILYIFQWCLHSHCFTCLQNWTPFILFFFKTNTNSTFSFQSWIVAVLEYFIQEEKKNNSLNRVKLVSHSQLKAQYVGHDLQKEREAKG